MLSYKNWKLMNESVGVTHALGISNPQNIGLVSNMPTEDEMLDKLKTKLDEAKKKLKKKMDGDVDIPK